MNDTTNTTTETNTEPLPQSNPVGEETKTPPQSTPAETTPEIPEYSKEAADALNAAYSLTKPESDPKEPQNSQSSTLNTQSDAYALTFPEEFSARPDAEIYNSILAPIAQQSGIDGEQFGKLFADSYAAIESARQRVEWQNRFQQDVELKKDWGADYEANMATARGHIAFLKEKAGLSDDDLAVFSSPKGMRALYAMATAHAAPPAAGLAQSASTEKAWAKAIMQPGHADYDAFINPMNPRYKEVNQRWLRANGQ